MSQNLRYSYEKPKASIMVRIRNRIAGWIDRRSILDQFVRDNNIDLENIDSQSVTRITYMIRTQHVEYLAHVRDQDLLREASRLRSIRRILLGNIDNNDAILTNEKAKLAILQEDLSAVVKGLADGQHSSLQKAHLQGDRGTLEASIKNQKNYISRIKQAIADNEEYLKNNREMFEGYRKELRNAYDMVLNSYTKVAGRKLNKIGFTLYDSEMRDVSSEIEEQVKEMVDGK